MFINKEHKIMNPLNTQKTTMEWYVYVWEFQQNKIWKNLKSTNLKPLNAQFFDRYLFEVHQKKYTKTDYFTLQLFTTHVISVQK